MADQEEVLKSWDLSDGTIPKSSHDRISLELDAIRQRLTHQQNAFRIGAGFAIVLALSFLCFSYKIVGFVECNQTFDWHVILLGSGLILPATLILYALIKHSHRPNTESTAPEPVGEMDMGKLPEALLRLADKQ